MLLLMLTSGMAAPHPAYVDTPLGKIPYLDAYWACTDESLVVGTITSVTPYAQAETLNGRFIGHATYSSFRLRVTRDIRDNAPRYVDFVVRGEIVQPNYNSVAPDTVQPIVGTTWAIAYDPLTSATAMWPAGTPMISASYYIHRANAVPRTRPLRRAVDRTCAALAEDSAGGSIREPSGP